MKSVSEIQIELIKRGYSKDLVLSEKYSTLIEAEVQSEKKDNSHKKVKTITGATVVGTLVVHRIRNERKKVLDKLEDEIAKKKIFLKKLEKERSATSGMKNKKYATAIDEVSSQLEQLKNKIWKIRNFYRLTNSKLWKKVK